MSDFELSAAEFRALYARVKHMARRGPADRLGTLNNTSPTQVVAAASDIWRGRAVSLAAPIENEVAADNPDPAVHQMTNPGTSPGPASGLSFALDRIAMNIHGNADSHIDALSHVIFDGTLYNGLSAGTVTATGATELSIEVAGGGIVGRGLLLDIPRVRRVPWLESGDLLFVRVSHRSRRRALGPWHAANARTRVASSGRGTPRGTADRGTWQRRQQRHGAERGRGTDFPVHVLAVNAMGLHLLDWLQFDDLVAVCEELNRWSFLCVVAPFRLRAATGSPVNPIALF